MPHSAAAPSASTTAVTRLSLADGPGGGLRVELVRVVEDGGLGRAGRLPVVVDGDRVQELGAHRGVERRRPLLDQPQPEVDVPEQPPLLGLAERRAAPELERAPDVVEERRREQEVARAAAGGAAPSRGRASRRRPCARAARRRSRGGRPRPRPGARGSAARDGRRRRGRAATTRREPGVRDLAGEEVEEAVELVGVAAHRRRQLGRIGVGRRLDRAHLHLQPAAEPLHASEHADGVALGEAAVEQLDVVPDARLDPAARVDELEREVGGAVLRPPPLLAPDGDTRPRRSGPRRARRCWSRPQSRSGR